MKPSNVLPLKDRVNSATPMRCPVCNGPLERVLIRDLGGVTADLVWQLHAGHCPEHGWFQCEVVSQPPGDIFPVVRPFGVARRVVIDGNEIFSFATVWNDMPAAEKLRKDIDPFDRRYWKVRHANRG